MAEKFGSDEEWEQTQFMFRSIGERLVGAGWATQAVDSQDGAVIVLTGKGIAGMDNIVEALKDLDPLTMRAEHIMGLFLHLTLREDRKNPPGES